MTFVLFESVLASDPRIETRDPDAYDDDELPFDPGKVMVVIDHHLVRCADDGKLVGGATRLEMAYNLLVEYFFSLSLVAMIHLNRNRWHPFVELVNPI